MTKEQTLINQFENLKIDYEMKLKEKDDNY